MICPGFLAEEPPPTVKSFSSCTLGAPIRFHWALDIVIELYLFAHRKPLPFPEMEIYLIKVNIRRSVEM